MENDLKKNPLKIDHGEAPTDDCDDYKVSKMLTRLLVSPVESQEQDLRGVS